MGVGTFALAIPLTGLPAEHPLIHMVAGVATSVAFASLGVVAGVIAIRIDHIFFLRGYADRRVANVSMGDGEPI